MQKLTPNKQEKLINELNRLIPDTEWKSTLIEHFENDDTYLAHRARALESYSNSKPNTIKQIIKATRTGFTNNSIMAGLDLGKKLLIVEPTNEIGRSTIRGAVDKYIEQTGRNDIMVRPIFSNEIVCTELDGKYKKKRKGIHVPIRTPECKECDATMYEPKEGEPRFPLYLEPDKGYCINKTMLREEKEFRDRGEEYAPDVVYTTYSKLENLRNNSTKNQLFRKMIKNRDVVLFDEFGHYLQQSSDSALIHEIAYQRDGVLIEGSEFDIKMMYELVMKFIDENKLEINVGTLNEDGKQASTRAKNCIEKYIKPVVNIFDELMAIKKRKNQTPSNRTNPLAFIPEVIETRDGDMQIVGRHEELRRTLEEQVNTIEEIGINEEGKLFIEDIWALFNVLQEEELIVEIGKGTEHEYTYGPDFDQKSVRVYAERVSITGSNRHKLRMLAEYADRYPKQEMLISDATLGELDLRYLASRHNLGGVDRKQIIENWGDPGDTNKEQMFFRYEEPESEHPIFSSEAWDMKPGHREEFIKQIRSIASELGAGNLFLISPKKDISLEILKNCKDIATRADASNIPQDKMIITHFNSTVSRGVESEKRICIELGSAKKPKGTYRAAMLGQLSLYLPSYIDNAGLEKFAEKEGISLKSLLNRIELFSYPKTPKPVPDVPYELKRLFDFIAEEHQKRVTASDTRQGVDRAKDPAALDRSVVIQLGVGDKESHEIVNLGADVVAGYAGIKKSRSKKHKIIAPQSKTVSDLSDVKTWMNGGDVDVPVTGYSKHFVSTLFKALVYNHGNMIDQDDILTNYGGKVKVGHSTGDKYDAMIVGEINVRQNEIESRGIKIHKTGNRFKMMHKFSLIKGFNPTEIMSTTEIGENVVKILQDAAEREGDRYSWRTSFRHKLHLTKEEFNNSLDFMDKYNILNGSTWNIGINKKNNKNNQVIFKG